MSRLIQVDAVQDVKWCIPAWRIRRMRRVADICGDAWYQEFVTMRRNGIEVRSVARQWFDATRIDRGRLDVAALACRFGAGLRAPCDGVVMVPRHLVFHRLRAMWTIMLDFERHGARRE